MKKKILITGAAALLAASMVACGSAKTELSAGLATVQTAVDTYLALYAPSWSGTATLNTAFNTAITDVANWKAGSVSTEIQTVLSDLASALDSVPQISGQTDTAIAAAVNFVDNLITIVQSESAANWQDQAAVFYGWLNDQTPPKAARKHAWSGKQIKTVKDFKKAWNKSAPKNAQIH